MPNSSAESNVALSDSDIEVVSSFLDKNLNPDIKAISKKKIFESIAKKLGSPMTEESFKLALAFAMKQNKLPTFEGKVGKNGGIGRKDSPKTSKSAVSVVLKNPEVMKAVVEKIRELPGCPAVHPEKGLQCTYEKDHANPHQNEFITWRDEEEDRRTHERVVKMMGGVDWGKDNSPVDEDDSPITELNNSLPPVPVEESKLESVVPLPPRQPSIGPSWTKPSPPSLVGTPQTLLLKGKRMDLPVSWAKANDLILRVFKLGEDPNGNVEFDGKRYVCSDEKMELLDDMIFFFFGGSMVIADDGRRPYTGG